MKLSARRCHSCGKSFATSFSLTLDEALRTGAIVRGMDLDESEVITGEEIADPIRTRLLKSGDEALIRITKVLPDEAYGRLQKIMKDP